MKWKIKAMFETTNQLSNFIITSSFGDFSSVWWMNLILVGGIPTPKNMSSSDWIITFIIPTIGENKSHVPSHQPAYWVEGGGLPESQGLLQDDHEALQCVKMTKGRGICQKCLFRYNGKRIFMSCNESEITASIIYQCISYSKSLSSQHAFFNKKTC